MRVLAVVAALTLAVAAPVAGAPSLASSGCPLMNVLVVADNGSSGFIGGVPDERWDDDALRQLRRVTLADFEAVDTARLRISPASAAARGAARTARAAPADAATPRTEPSLPPASVQATPPPSSAGATDPAAAPPDPGSEAVLPQILAAILGVVAAALAFREVARRTRRPNRRP
jgi:hypothetical protein